MDTLAIIALIALVVFGVMALRLKSDPMENETIRSSLANVESPTSVDLLDTPPDSKSASHDSTD
jgi:hypothetical protein